jgi:hypothetical protein
MKPVVRSKTGVYEADAANEAMQRTRLSAGR